MKLRLENLSLDEDDPEGESTQAELEDLADELQRAGYETTVQPYEEAKLAVLQESVGSTAVDVLNVVITNAPGAITGAAVSEAISAIKRWATGRRRFRGYEPGDRPHARIYGPSGDVISVVELPDPESGVPRRRL